MRKNIKLHLTMNGCRVFSLGELRENITYELLMYHKSGQLRRWLVSHGYHHELTEIDKIVTYNDVDTLIEIGGVLGVRVLHDAALYMVSQKDMYVSLREFSETFGEWCEQNKENSFSALCSSIGESQVCLSIMERILDLKRLALDNVNDSKAREIDERIEALVEEFKKDGCDDLSVQKSEAL